MYEMTQARYAQQGVTTVSLYRGTRDSEINGIPMAPWSTKIEIGQAFGNVLNRASMPVRYLLTDHTSTLFVTPYQEFEYLVLESAAKRRARKVRDYKYRTPSSTYADRTEIDWSIKNTMQLSSVWAESNGEYDIRNGSLYEPEYNIFYNYPGKKVDTTRTRKKHLPGKHDQRTHGRRGRAGTAFANAYVSARQEGKPHRDALADAKTAAEQVRQQMRDEKRYWENRLQQDDTPARPSIDDAPNIRDYPPSEIAAYIERRFASIESRVEARYPKAREAELDAEYQRLSTEDFQYGRAFVDAVNSGDATRIAQAKADSDAATKRATDALTAKLQFQEARRRAYGEEEYDAHMKVFGKLRHPTDPWTSASITMPKHPEHHKSRVDFITGKKVSGDNRAEMLALQQAVFAMFPEPTFYNGDPFPMAYRLTPSVQRGQFDVAYIKGMYGGVARYPPPDSPRQYSTFVHELLHAVQYSRSDSNPINAMLGAWAIGRTQGEQIQSLRALTGSNGYDKSEMAYRDRVDNPYTLKRQGTTGPASGFREVLPMAFSYLRDASSRTDKELLAIALEAVLATTKEMS
jgi:hypothetical protein